jgi:seryl-tRNA synthetase
MLTDIFTQNMLSLGLHIHHLEVCSGDIGIKNYRQIDIEAWFPAQKTFRELCSSSNCSDYQTRNLNIKYKTVDGEVKLAHYLNCTGVTNRAMFAIMEQNQQADGRVKVPEVLVPLFGSEWLE